MPNPKFDPEKDLPDLKGKVICVTGANGGLGKACVKHYARHGPAKIWLAARNAEKAKAAIADIQKELGPDTGAGTPIEFLELDLASLGSVQKAAQRVRAESPRLDILMLNAGVMCNPPGLTADGYELQFGTNHMGHALLTKLLLPLLLQTAALEDKPDVRVVVMSSEGHKFALPKTGIDLALLKTETMNVSTARRYGVSKLANALFARELARRFPQITAAAVHPGFVTTNLGHSMADSWMRPAVQAKIMGFLAYVPPFQTPDRGSRNQIWASVSKDVVSGEYYSGVGKGGSQSAFAKDDDLARRLWEWTETELARFEV
ncbi:short-chain dehydrogenase/reductase [Apiospora rasikravindrae]|uniref:Short-chain dehydrogenase/reductase n=1 Tax=Apiospora rasikravindrae TaxID=990691 RepID=A0ABR1UCX1_9PEZI